MDGIRSNRDGNRRLENGRMVYYKQTANQDFWESIWSKGITPNYYKPFQAGNLFDFEKIFKRHLPKAGMILEAGCGTAQLVVALNSNNYNCMGFDYAINAMRKARQMVRSLRLVAGDLTTIGISNDAFDAIISIGVVEHRHAGPEVFLYEMSRVLKPGGLLMISVPYFNPLRAWRARHDAYQDDVSGLDFYQYAFSREEFCSILESTGYEIETTYSYAHQNTLTQELHWLGKIPGFIKKLLLRVSKHMPYVNSELGHMLMVVARNQLALLIEQEKEIFEYYENWSSSNRFGSICHRGRAIHICRSFYLP
ncbi:MAG: class I SAM-dependent methyltransferase [Anaerolineales bacterium]|nr:class I SAM-dependent methyltransferase [Anaerolineales bacterium]